MLSNKIEVASKNWLPEIASNSPINLTAPSIYPGVHSDCCQFRVDKKPVTNDKTHPNSSRITFARRSVLHMAPYWMLVTSWKWRTMASRGLFRITVPTMVSLSFIAVYWFVVCSYYYRTDCRVKYINLKILPTFYCIIWMCHCESSV